MTNAKPPIVDLIDNAHIANKRYSQLFDNKIYLQLHEDVFKVVRDTHTQKSYVWCDRRALSLLYIIGDTAQVMLGASFQAEGVTVRYGSTYLYDVNHSPIRMIWLCAKYPSLAPKIMLYLRRFTKGTLPDA